jgi:hypothetical protein
MGLHAAKTLRGCDLHLIRRTKLGEEYGSTVLPDMPCKTSVDSASVVDRGAINDNTTPVLTREFVEQLSKLRHAFV